MNLDAPEEGVGADGRTSTACAARRAGRGVIFVERSDSMETVWLGVRLAKGEAWSGGDMAPFRGRLGEKARARR